MDPYLVSPNKTCQFGTSVFPQSVYREVLQTNRAPNKCLLCVSSRDHYSPPYQPFV